MFYEFKFLGWSFGFSLSSRIFCIGVGLNLAWKGVPLLELFLGPVALFIEKALIRKSTKTGFDDSVIS